MLNASETQRDNEVSYTRQKKWERERRGLSSDGTHEGRELIDKESAIMKILRSLSSASVDGRREAITRVCSTGAWKAEVRTEMDWPGVEVARKTKLV